MKTIRSMFEHAYWANSRIVEHVSKLGAGHAQAVKLLSHVLKAEQIWLTRLQGQDSSSIALWGVLSIDACRELAEQNYAGYKAYFDQSPHLDDLCSYKNQAGEPFETPIRDILTHAALHGQYHRGQINTLLRMDDKEPVALDYITFVR